MVLGEAMPREVSILIRRPSKRGAGSFVKLLAFAASNAGIRSSDLPPGSGTSALSVHAIALRFIGVRATSSDRLAEAGREKSLGVWAKSFYVDAVVPILLGSGRQCFIRPPETLVPSSAD